jgi:nitroreductase
VVREFTGELVNQATVETLLQAAVQAPSAVNHQPWAFVVIQDAALLERYSTRAKTLFAQTMDMGALTPKFRDLVSDPAFNIFYNAGTLIVICARPIGQHPDWDCCLAAENLMLAAHGMGLGSCPIGFAWSLLEQADVKAALQIPPDCKVVMPIIVGRPAKTVVPVTRLDPMVLCWK